MRAQRGARQQAQPSPRSSGKDSVWLLESEGWTASARMRCESAGARRSVARGGTREHGARNGGMSILDLEMYILEHSPRTEMSLLLVMAQASQYSA